MLESKQPREGELGVAPLTRAERVHNAASILHPTAVLRHLRTPLYSNAYYLMANTGFLSLSGLLFWAIAARVYNASDVGIGSALIAASTLLASISGLDLGTGLIRFLPSSEQPWSLIATCVAVALAMSVVLGILFVSGVSLWSPDLAFIARDPLLLVAFVLFTAGSTVSALLDNLFVALRRASLTMVKNLFIGFGRIPLLVFLVVPAGAFGVFGSIGLATLPTVAVALWWVRHSVDTPQGEPAWLRREAVATLMPYSLANYVAGLVYRAPALLLPLIVLRQLGPEANASFYVSWMLGGLLCVIPNAICQSLFAEGSRFERDLRDDVIKAVKVSLYLLVPVVAGAFLLADKLLLLFGAAYAQEGAVLLRILALAALPILVNTAYLTVKRVERQMTPIITLSALIAVGTLALSYGLMPRLGVEATAVGWLVSQAAAATLVVLSLLRHRWQSRRCSN
jgi:O-antigen/teichoic acid export membrane protein